MSKVLQAEISKTPFQRGKWAEKKVFQNRVIGQSISEQAKITVILNWATRSHIRCNTYVTRNFCLPHAAGKSVENRLSKQSGINHNSSYCAPYSVLNWANPHDNRHLSSPPFADEDTEARHGWICLVKYTHQTCLLFSKHKDYFLSFPVSWDGLIKNSIPYTIPNLYSQDLSGSSFSWIHPWKFSRGGKTGFSSISQGAKM